MTAHGAATSPSGSTGLVAVGIDIQLDTYIDNPQMEYFNAQAQRLRPGDAVILCCAARAGCTVAQAILRATRCSTSSSGRSSGPRAPTSA